MSANRMAINQDMIWDDAATAILAERWLAGDSAGKIAKQIPGATKNSVIGKRRRLKLPQRPGARGTSTVTDDEIITAIRAGGSNNRIATRLHVSPPRVAILRETCVDAPRPVFGPIGRPRNAVDRDAIIAAWNTKVTSISRLASEFRIARETVVEILALPVSAPAPIAQTVFDLVVIPRPAPIPVMPAWRSMPIPRSKECVWVEEGQRKREWIYCDAPTVKGKSYCKCHDDMAYVRGSAE